MLTIALEQVKRGIQDGVIHFILDPNAEHGTVCEIGDNWFYFGGESAETENPESYVRNVPFDDLSREVFDVLEDFREDEGFADEYAYYATVLDESEKD